MKILIIGNRFNVLARLSTVVCEWFSTYFIDYIDLLYMLIVVLLEYYFIGLWSSGDITVYVDVIIRGPYHRVTEKTLERSS